MQNDDAVVIPERCENCRFGGARWVFIAPEPLPAPIERRALFGLIRWQQKPSRWEQAMHDHRAEQAENWVPCCRYPEDRPVKKTHWCGEYQPRKSILENSHG